MEITITIDKEPEGLLVKLISNKRITDCLFTVANVGGNVVSVTPLSISKGENSFFLDGDQMLSGMYTSVLHLDESKDIYKTFALQ